MNKVRPTTKVVILVTAMLIAPLVSAGHHAKKEKNLVETAAAAGTFNTLIAAAKAAGLAGALTGNDDLTVFAPTDSAFEALPAGTVESLLKPENKNQLATIIKYHVIAGKVGSSALADGASLDTLAGIPATITASEGGFLIENAQITATDISASNGVVHVIDRVILPPAQVSKTDAQALIRMAINQGAPMYNHGNATATTAVYAMAARSLMSLGNLTEAENKRLAKALTASEHSSDMRMAAWELRYALDDVSASLSGKPMPVNTMTAMNQ